MSFALPSNIASTSGTKPIPPSPRLSRSSSSTSSTSSGSSSPSSSYGSFKSASSKSVNFSPSHTPPLTPSRQIIHTDGLREIEIYYDRIKGKVAGIYKTQIELAKEAKQKPWKITKNKKLIQQENEKINKQSSNLLRKGFEIIQKTHDPDPKKMHLKIKPIQTIAYDFRDGWVATRKNPSPRMSHEMLDKLHKEARNVLLFGNLQ